MDKNKPQNPPNEQIGQRIFEFQGHMFYYFELLSRFKKHELYPHFWNSGNVLSPKGSLRKQDPKGSIWASYVLSSPFLGG